MLDRMNKPEPIPALRNPSASEISGLLAEAEQAGEGIAAFARARNLKQQKLYVWRRRLKAKPPAFDQVRIVESAPEPAAFVLELQAGIKLSVPSDFDSPSVRRLAEVLHAC
jgi:hypothetical protein